jgi:Zn-dependent protease with chaperone function
VFVGWESVAGVLGLCVAVLVLGWPLGSIVRSRLALTKDLLEALAQMPESLEQRKRLALEQESFLRRVGLLRRGYDVMTMGAYALACFVFGWPDYVAFVGVPHGLEVLPDIAPYLALLCLSWLNHWRVERAARGGWRLSAFMGFNLRGNAMMLAPVVLVSAGIFALRATFVQFDDAMDSFQFLQLLVQMGMMLLVVVFLPASIRYILPSTRLPEGPLRTRLTEFARARRLGVREIYIWNTRSRHIATAFVIGLIAPLRYVFITDALMRELDEEEIEAVFAHELGHAHHNHLWWLLMFLFTVSIVLLGAATLFGQLPVYLKEQELARGLSDATALLPWAFTFGYAYVVFGYVSRRFERQADFFAVAHTRPEVLARVFFKLGASSGHDMGKRGWRHFSLEQRIREIALVAARPEVKRVFSRELALVIAVAVLITLGCTAALWPSIREDVVTGQMNYVFAQFDRARIAEPGGAEMEALRARVLARAQGVRELDEHNARVAEIYEAITDVLSGKNAHALTETQIALEKEGKLAANADKQNYFEALLKFVKQSERAALRARQDNSLWYEEMEKEIKASRSSP